MSLSNGVRERSWHYRIHLLIEQHINHPSKEIFYYIWSLQSAMARQIKSLQYMRCVLWVCCMCSSMFEKWNIFMMCYFTLFWPCNTINNISWVHICFYNIGLDELVFKMCTSYLTITHTETHMHMLHRTLGKRWPQTLRCHSLCQGTSIYWRNILYPGCHGND